MTGANVRYLRLTEKKKSKNSIFTYLKSIYKPIRETYKYYAGASPCGYVP